jgi:hypothetical protein
VTFDPNARLQAPYVAPGSSPVKKVVRWIHVVSFSLVQGSGMGGQDVHRWTADPG